MNTSSALMGVNPQNNSYELTNTNEPESSFARAKTKNASSKCQTIGASVGSAVGGLIGGGIGLGLSYALGGLLMPSEGANDIKTTYEMMNVTENGNTVPKNVTVVHDTLGQCQMRELAEITMGAGSAFGVWVGGIIGSAIGSYVGSRR